MTKLRVLDLFSGIGGFSLGLERTGGFETVAFCEIEPYCRRVLAKHWPEIPIYDDVRKLTAAKLAADGLAVDVICGGFPCQDISLAGKGAGLAGERSGLWRDYARLIGELRPQFVIVENVAALLSRGLGDVLGDLAAIGYDAEWHCIPAAAVGAPHRRDRLWIVAYARGNQHKSGCAQISRAIASQLFGPNTYADEPGLEGWNGDGVRERAGEWATRASGALLADSDQPRKGQRREQRGGQQLRPCSDQEAHSRRGPASQWLVEPDVGRVAHGVSARVDRLRGLGNAVVPQIPELIGRALLANLETREGA